MPTKNGQRGIIGAEYALISCVKMSSIKNRKDSLSHSTANTWNSLAQSALNLIFSSSPNCDDVVPEDDNDEFVDEYSLFST